MDGAALAWWRRGAIYQIYPRSFADADGDGVGDLRGIASRLDHLEELGVEAIWLSPFFTSPMADFGYDVADYCDVDPLFGTLEDFDALLAACQRRGIRMVIDWVPNHTSDRHPWFEASRSARDDPRRDWYVWRDPAPRRRAAQRLGVGLPRLRAGLDARRPHRPVLPALLHAASSRTSTGTTPRSRPRCTTSCASGSTAGSTASALDAIAKIAKDPLLRDQNGAPRRHDEDWESIHDRLRGIRRVIDSYDDRMLVGEVALKDLHRTVSYLRSGDQLHLAHNFVWVELPWQPDAFRTSISDFESLADETAWPAWFLANHDLPRTASRYDAGGHGRARARAIALMLYALCGTPFLYQGEELGLRDAEIPPDRVVDVDGRDPQRSPLPWRPPSLAGPGAGFTTGTPWLPLGADAEMLCVERQAADPGSMLALVRRLAALRRETPALQRGAQRFVDAGPEVLAWLREFDGDRVLAAINFSPERAPLGAALSGSAGVLVSTDADRPRAAVDLGALMLGPSEGVLLALN